MAASGDEDYRPQDALAAGLRGALFCGGAGFLFAAVRNSLEKQNVGPWGVFTRSGKIIAAATAIGTSYEFSRTAAANLRGKDDYVNAGIGGLVAGAVHGLSSGKLPRVLGMSAGLGVIMGTFTYCGASLRGPAANPDEDYLERKEMKHRQFRLPMDQTVTEIGEGRSAYAPNYEERRRARLKEKYGVEVKTLLADPKSYE